MLDFFDVTGISNITEEIFNFNPNFNFKSSQIVNKTIHKNKFAVENLINFNIEIPNSFEFDFFLETKEQENTLIDFFLGRKGKLKAFWCMGWKTAFNLVQDAFLGTNFIRVANSNYVYQGRERIYFLLTDNRVIVRKITNYTKTTTYTEIELDSNLPIDLSNSNIAHIGFFYLVRFNTDLLKFEIESHEVSKISLSFVELVHEYQAKTITVNTPNGLEVWATVEKRRIVWDSDNLESSINIKLYKDDVFLENIEDNYPNTGFLDWLVPDYLLASDKYQIRIEDYTDNTIFDTSDNYFQIDKTPEIITVLEPNDGSDLERESTWLIKWFSQGFNDRIDIGLLPFSSTNIAENILNEGEYAFYADENLSIGTGRKVQVRRHNLHTVLDTSDNPFEVIYKSREINFLTPPDEDLYLLPGQFYTITWQTLNIVESDDLEIDIQYYDIVSGFNRDYSFYYPSEGSKYIIKNTGFHNYQIPENINQNTGQLDPLRHRRRFRLTRVLTTSGDITGYSNTFTTFEL